MHRNISYKFSVLDQYLLISDTKAVGNRSCCRNISVNNSLKFWLLRSFGINEDDNEGGEHSTRNFSFQEFY